VEDTAATCELVQSLLTVLLFHAINLQLIMRFLDVTGGYRAVSVNSYTVVNSRWPFCFLVHQLYTELHDACFMCAARSHEVVCSYAAVYR